MSVKSYVVQHTMVGAHAAGDVVNFTEDQVKNLGIDVERLLRIGAVREANSDEAKTAVDYGSSSDTLAPLFPPVPFQGTLPGSPDPQRSESPPTNPQDGIDPNPRPVGGEVSHEPKPVKK